MVRSCHPTTEDMGTHEKQAKSIRPKNRKISQSVQQLETKQSMGTT
jgi:hypothetical protein